MPTTGLSDQEWVLIRGVIRQHPEVSQVKLFGSRAKGMATQRSDIDLALFGDLDALKAQTIQSELEELPLPYKFDVKHFDSIQLPALREHIERVGVAV